VNIKAVLAYTTKKLHELFIVTQQATEKLRDDDVPKHVGAVE
jgi:hypothetical protein